MKVFIYISYGDTILFAEHLGWIEPTEPEDSKVDWGDCVEESALNYIASKDYEIDYDYEWDDFESPNRSLYEN